MTNDMRGAEVLAQQTFESIESFNHHLYYLKSLDGLTSYPNDEDANLKSG
ncbi:MAG: hypothetical protein AAF664_18760 [Planctomycetota bacterium]